MSPYQKHLASELLSAGLSQTAYIKGVTIMSLEDVLRIMEKDNGERRNPEKYSFAAGQTIVFCGLSAENDGLARGERILLGIAPLPVVLLHDAKHIFQAHDSDSFDIGRLAEPGA